VNKFNAFVDVSKQLSLANYQVYAWYLMPINAAEWVSVFYIGMTKNSKRRIEESINREFPKRYAGRKVSRLVIKDGLTKSAALTLEASLQSCFGDFYLQLTFLYICFRS
jgi:predicted GIY-YIG superfamily endonuclease